MAVKSGQTTQPFTRFSGTGPAPTESTFNLNHKYHYMETYKNYVSQLGRRRDEGSEWKFYSFEQNIQPAYCPPWRAVSGGAWRGGDYVPAYYYSIAKSDAIINTLNAMMNESRTKAPTAIALTNPTVPMVDLGTSIGEILTGGLPSLVGSSLWKDKARVARGSGSEYLNYQFGWVPLINDIRTTAKVVDDIGNLIAKYEAGSGKDQHRRFKFPVKESTETILGTATFSPTDTTTWASTGRTVVVKTTTTRIWFSGCFRYYLPKTGFERQQALARKFYGADINPSTLWNLAPWSWALDWQGNIGDVLSNMSYLGRDASAMRYGYMMHEKIVHHDVRQVVRSSSSSPLKGRDGVATMQVTESFKTRVKGSPYSFSANPVALTGKQAAIVAALGLSRSRV